MLDFDDDLGAGFPDGLRSYPQLSTSATGKPTMSMNTTNVITQDGRFSAGTKTEVA
jgi:hypothetical protein